MAEVGSPPAREARGVSRAILEGVYDQGSPLSVLQGTPHLLQIIWDFLRAYWAHVIKLPRGIRLPLRSDGVMCADCEERGPTRLPLYKFEVRNMFVCGLLTIKE